LPCFGQAQSETASNLAFDVVNITSRLISQQSLSKRIASQAHKISGANEDGHCVASVREILHHSGVLPSNQISLYARDADKVLMSKGFVNLTAPGALMENSANPCLAPEGSILVYEGGPLHPKSGVTCNGQPCGHIEIKVGPHEYDAQKKDMNPITGCAKEGSQKGAHYKLKAILIAPGVLEQIPLPGRVLDPVATEPFPYGSQ